MAGINKTDLRSMATDIARQLDRKDTKGEDGKIEASIWNEFVADKGGKQIKNSITVENAIKSIAAYISRNAAKTGEAFGDIADKWFDKESTPVDETIPIKETNPTEGTKQTTPQKTKSSSKVQADIDFINARVTVPLKTVSAKKPNNKLEVDLIQAKKIDGKNVAERLKRSFKSAEGLVSPTTLASLKRDLECIDKDNVAYVLKYFANIADAIDSIDSFGMGFDKKEVIQYVLSPLLDRAKELRIIDGKDKEAIIEESKNGSLEDINKILTKYYKAIRTKDEQILSNYENQMKEYNANVEEVNEYNKTEHPKIQKCFDDAVKFMAEAANTEPKPEIEEGTTLDGENFKSISLPDGRWIDVIYDENGEIKKININYDTKLSSDGEDYADAKFYSDLAVAHSDHTKPASLITSGFDFEKLKALAKRIFD